MPTGALHLADAEQEAAKIRAEMGWTRGTRRRPGRADPFEIARQQAAEERARRAETETGRAADASARPGGESDTSSSPPI
jgi:hypothetical protein